MEPTTAAAADATDLSAVFARIQGMLLSQESAQAAASQLALAARDLIDSAAGAARAAPPSRRRRLIPCEPLSAPAPFSMRSLMGGRF